MPIVGSLDQAPSVWLELLTLVGSAGGVVSILNGPRCRAAVDQLPARSWVRTCAYHVAPSARAALLKDVPPAFTAGDGSVAAF